MVPPKHIIHDWIREDLPLAVKMSIRPEHVEKLLVRIEQYDALDAFVSSFIASKEKEQNQ